MTIDDCNSPQRAQRSQRAIGRRAWGEEHGVEGNKAKGREQRAGSKQKVVGSSRQEKVK